MHKERSNAIYKKERRKILVYHHIYQQRNSCVYRRKQHLKLSRNPLQRPSNKAGWTNAFPSKIINQIADNKIDVGVLVDFLGCSQHKPTLGKRITAFIANPRGDGQHIPSSKSSALNLELSSAIWRINTLGWTLLTVSLTVTSGLVSQRAIGMQSWCNYHH